jgi:hypothetical protein
MDLKAVWESGWVQAGILMAVVLAAMAAAMMVDF